MKRWKARAGAHLRGRAESESCCTPGGRPTVTVWQETIARRLREFHLDSIRNQMLVFAVAATLVPALALTVMSSRKSEGSIGDQIAQELRGTSTRRPGRSINGSAIGCAICGWRRRRTR